MREAGDLVPCPCISFEINIGNDLERGYGRFFEGSTCQKNHGDEDENP
jgi:hypothetical protein